MSRKTLYENQLESLERLRAENKVLHERVNALENVVRQMNAYFEGDA